MDPLQYLRLPKCKGCGTSDKGYRVVKIYEQITCKCMGYHFPHRYLSPNCLERTIADNCGIDWKIYKGGFNPLNGVIRRRLNVTPNK